MQNRFIAGKQAGIKTILIGEEKGLADYRFPTLDEATKWLSTKEN